ncbi:MAG: ribonuclease R [Planctomycetota bacterium]|jgi:ribonuclease R
MKDGEEQKGFKSFKDLLRSKGEAGEPDVPETQEDRGWTIESEGEVKGAAIDSTKKVEVNDLSNASRERIDSRPTGFGDMTTGPPPYRDQESEEMQLLGSFRVRTFFPPDVLGELIDLPEDPGEADFAGRRDLRDQMIFTIDGADAKDYDDAISIESLEDGAVKIGVHIADVAHYVCPGTALDDEALARGTSVYLADQVVPMLPETLSNGLCSLVPDRPRLAYSVVMEFDAKGARRASEVHKSVIKSVKRCTYKNVQALLDGEASPEADELRFIEEPLRLFERWTKTQQRLRDAKGALRINSKERKFVFDENHEVEAIVDYPKYFSNTLIEETALAANQAVGDLFVERGLPTIYRVHPEKDPDEIEAVAKLLEEHNIHVPDKQRLTGRDIGRMIRAARNRPNAEALIGRIMGLVERAIYEVRDHEDVATHFGLARKAYLHFTSPIRRYPDLIVHRWLWAIETRADEAADELQAEAFIEDLNHVAAHCSQQSEISQMVETAVGDLKICQFMEPHIEERIEAKVHRVSRAGIEVHLPELNVFGFLPSRSIGDRPEQKGPTLKIRAGRRSLSFTEGYPIGIIVKDVDFLRLQVILELA